jgi:hypothetical protein
MLMRIKSRKSGIPTGNAGEYFVMGELLKRGFDAQLADRNTQGYDMLVGRAEAASLRKVQVKTSRSPSSWYVKLASFEGKNLRSCNGLCTPWARGQYEAGSLFHC